MRLYNLTDTILSFEISGAHYSAQPYAEVVPEVDDTLASEGTIFGNILVLPNAQQFHTTVPHNGPYIALGRGPLVSSAQDAGGLGWRDMVGQIYLPGSDINDPTRSAILSSGHQGYKFDIGKNFEIVYHLQHDLVPGMPIYFHVHWVAAPVDTSSPDLNPVTWLWHYEYARGFGRGHFDFSPNGDDVFVHETQAPLAPLAKVDTPTVFDQLTHMTTEIASPIENALFEPDGILTVHMHRAANADVGVMLDDNADGIFVLTADCHYLADRLATPNRQPPFGYIEVNP